MTPPYTCVPQKQVFSGQSFGFHDCPSTVSSTFRAKHKYFASAPLQSLNCYAFHSIACVGTFPELKRYYRPNSHSHLSEVLISKIPTNTYCFSPPGCGTSTSIHFSAADFWVLCFLTAESARTSHSAPPADCMARKVLPDAPVVSMCRHTTVQHLCASNLYQPSSGTNCKTDF